MFSSTNWKMRYFVVTTEGVLTYYESENGFVNKSARSLPFNLKHCDVSEEVMCCGGLTFIALLQGDDFRTFIVFLLGRKPRVGLQLSCPAP